MPGWWRRLLAWDGVLPLVMAAIPLAARLLLPRNDPVVAFMTCGVLPVVAALIRTGFAAHRLREMFDGRLPVLRQLTIGAAISVLMLFEGAVAILTFAGGKPLAAWLYPTGFFFTYLICIAFALRPPRYAASSPQEQLSLQEQ